MRAGLSSELCELLPGVVLAVVVVVCSWSQVLLGVLGASCNRRARIDWLSAARLSAEPLVATAETP